MTSPNLAAALTLAGHGIAVFPCAPDKKPRPGVRWRQEATADEARIRSWWRRWPDSLPAFEPGRHQLVVIDCDRHGQADGVAALEAMAGERGEDHRDWPTVETPSTGRHVFFRQDGSLTNARGTLPAGIDVRGTGGYVIAEGATLPDGRAYQPLGDGLIAAMEHDAVPRLPDWLADILKPPVPVVMEPERVSAVSSPLPPANSGARERAAFEAALASEIANVRGAVEGQRNATLNTSAFCLYQMVASGWGGAAEVEHAMTQAALAIGLRQPEIGKTLASARRSGMAKPRPPLSDREGHDAPAIEIRLKRKDGVTYDAETGEIVEDGEDDDEDGEEAAPPIDEGLTRVDGVLGDLVEWITSCSPTGNRLLSLAAALPLMGTVLGRRMATPTGGGLELYIISLLESGGGKSAPMACVSRLMEMARLDNQHIAPPEFRSGAAFGDQLCRAPLSLSIIDEIADYFGVLLGDRQQSHQVELEKLLKEQWGKGFDQPLRTAHSRSASGTKVSVPCYSIYGTTTPEAFFRVIKSRHVTGGFANRLTVINASGANREHVITGNIRTPPARLVEAIQSLYAMGGGGGNLTAYVDKNSAVDPEPVIVPWESQTAEKRFTDFDAECKGFYASMGDMGKIYGRTAFMAVKIATIRACGRHSPVTLADMEWGIAVARQSADLFRHELASKMLDPLSAGEMLMKLEEQFTKPTEKGRAMMARFGGMTLSRRFLFKNLKRHINRHPGEFENALKALQYGGQVVIHRMSQSGAKDGLEVVTYTGRRRAS